MKDAPRVDPDAEISPEEQERLYSYYGLVGAMGDETGESGPIGADQDDLDRSGVNVAGTQDLSGSDADLRTDVAMPGRDAGPVGGGTSRDDTDADSVLGYDAATLSDTGYGAGTGLAGAGVGRAPHPDDGIAGPSYNGGQAAEADALRERIDDHGSEEDILGRFYGEDGMTGGHRDRAEMGEAGAIPAQPAPLPGTAGASGASQGDPAMQTESGAIGLPPGTQEVGAGMQRQPDGGMRLRRYVVRQETIAPPLDQQDELRMQPGAASSMDDASTGIRMDDQDFTGPDHR